MNKRRPAGQVPLPNFEASLKDSEGELTSAAEVSDSERHGEEKAGHLFDPDGTISPSREAVPEDPLFTQNGGPRVVKVGKTTTEAALPRSDTERLAYQRAVEISVNAMNEDLDRTAELSGNTPRIAFENKVGSRPDRAPAVGTPESQASKHARMSDLRHLNPTGQRIADSSPSDKSVEASKAEILYGRTGKRKS